MHRFFAISTAAAVFAAAASAQCFNPAGGTSITATMVNHTGLDPVHDEGRSPVTDMLIAFPMPGAALPAYTHCVIESNGLIYLSNASGPTMLGNYVYGSLFNLSGSAGQSPRIAPFWRDLWAPNPAAWDITTQSVPGVSFKVSWINVSDYFTMSPVRSFSATLYATGAVEYSYDGTVVTTSAFVGLSVGNGAGGAAVASNFVANPTGGTLPLMYESFTGASWDLANRTIRFTPNGLGGWNVSTPCVQVSASHTSYGAGCYRLSDSIYQRFASAALASAALSNTAITFTPNGNGGYVVSNGGAYLAVGSVQATPSIVAVGDDVEQFVPFSVGSFPGALGVAVASNGFVSLATGNDPTWNVTPASLLNDPQTSFRSAHDMNPTIPGSGQIKHEESAGLTMVTWDGVWDFGGTSVADANNIQIQLYSSGVVVVAWGSLSPLGASGIGYVVGMSPGGPSVDGGSITLATALPANVLSPAAASPMALSATPAPVSTASSGTLVTYTQSNIPEAAPGSGVYLGVTILSLGQNLPGIDLGFLGMPGCSLHITSFDWTLAFIGTSNTLPTQLQLPPGVAPGTTIFAQSAALIVPNSLPNGLNALGVTLSNALASYISLF